jgi:uncharacterized protein YggU (UPF0235/DUF167 family)
VQVTIRLTSRAGRGRIDGVAHLADGQAALKVAVVAGQRSRSKIVHIAGDPDGLRQHLGAVLAALPRT